MVAANPLFRYRWTVQRFNATILSDILPEVFFFSAFSAMVTLVTLLTPYNLGLHNQLLTVSGVVLGLVISFRTSSAYERFRDGNRLWTNIMTASRTLASQIWIHVSNEREAEKGSDQKPPTPFEVVMEKKTIINVIGAFPVSVKHFLRGEPGVYYEDLYPLVCFLPKYATDSARAPDVLPLWHIYGGRRLPAATLKRNDTLVSFVQHQHPPLKPAYMPPTTTIYDYIGILKLPRFIFRRMFRSKYEKIEEEQKPLKKRIAYSEVVESTVPLELLLVISNYTAYVMKNNLCHSAIGTGMTNTLAILQDALGQLDRICNNPLPFAYQAHLRMSLWLYLLILPFQLVPNFGYWTIPATAFVAFLLTGFLEIGQEIENPFNYGLNDLDLDWFCESLKRDLHQITTQPNAVPSQYFNNRNIPFAPLDNRSAEEMLIVGEGEYYPNDKESMLRGTSEIRQVLVRNWRQVDVLTRRQGDQMV
ncbi:UPF0187-domain-containing protein [Coprinopsis marcescibilis]|uniref:UPF0187-domain-containing protein n=1 Tax=Coprinopsis marcescibilis TaxID=230819 RepID=A0A5C3KN05_COPMA|nr:UPF0187-domain-containing protein [Coprinopsis marcescibilis]